MRALIVRPGPNFSVEDVARGWHNGLTELGVKVLDYDLGGAIGWHENAKRALDDEHSPDAIQLACDALLAVCMKGRPDFVLIVSSFFVTPQTYATLRAWDIPIVTYLTECPYEDDAGVDIAPWANIVLLNDPTNLDRFRAVQPNTYYQWHCYDPTVHYRRQPKPECRSDFVFVGTGYPSRIDFFEQVDFTGLDVALAGNWQNLPANSPLRKYVAHDIAACVANDDAHDLYAASRASCNLYRTEAQRDGLEQGWAMGPREVELAASGTFFLTQERGENREVLPMVPTFETPDDLSDRLRWWLNRPDDRADVVARAQRAVADRTFRNSAQRLLALLALTNQKQGALNG